MRAKQKRVDLEVYYSREYLYLVFRLQIDVHRHEILIKGKF